MPPEFLRAHSERDHRYFGWAAAYVAVAGILRAFTNSVEGFWRLWPVPWFIVNVYFTWHTEPDVKLRYPSWLDSWKDPTTRVHRIISAGGILASVVEWGILQLSWNSALLRALLPVGQITAGILFMFHHHSGESVVVKRQHDVMAACLIFAGVALGGSRLWSPLQLAGFAWPWLIAVLAYLFITYTEAGEAVGHPMLHRGSNDAESGMGQRHH